ncbi:MAG: phospholipid carrier-dependent glycosyltransferase [Rhodospirillales bacterium]|nr:phospholipid carrier-dependent glycosyltransferase [Acetobacter sp.]
MFRFREFTPPSTLLLICIAFAIAALYLYGSSAVGVLGPDEPRYSAIGHAMLQRHDFVTPVLWGSPWFEKPPLLYWMTAAGAAWGLSPEAAGRIPVALMSLCFLLSMFWFLRAEFGLLAAACSTCMLATAAGWLAYSGLCLTDIPLAVSFGVAVFLSLPLLRPHPDERASAWRFAGIGICLGLGALAKGLVPFALALPFFWFLRAYRRQFVWAIGACLLVALPWYLLVYARNGWPFIDELFIRHHFERLYSDALQHGQPPYYYVPVLLAGTFPWTALLLLLIPFRSRGGLAAFDRRERFLLVLVAFGFVFFSCSYNKLPGYLLPLLPPLFALLGSRLAQRGTVPLDRRWLLACALPIALIPLVAELLPPSLIAGRFVMPPLFLRTGTPFLVYALVPLVALFFRHRTWIAPALLASAILGGFLIKMTAYPVLDGFVSARRVWYTVQSQAPRLCDAGTRRDWIYGLSFYRGSFIGYCQEKPGVLAIRSHEHSLPQFGPLH